MSSKPKRKDAKPQGPLCQACLEYGIKPAGTAVDRDGVSPDEVDTLCTVHRARTTEGYCTLCARRLPWMPIRSGSAIGICRDCYVARNGEEKARSFEGVRNDEDEY